MERGSLRIGRRTLLAGALLIVALVVAAAVLFDHQSTTPSMPAALDKICDPGTQLAGPPPPGASNGSCRSKVATSPPYAYAIYPTAPARENALANQLGSIATAHLAADGYGAIVGGYSDPALRSLTDDGWSVLARIN